nr:MAG: hypothetical protein [Bacteriophage sp.]
MSGKENTKPPNKKETKMEDTKTLEDILTNPEDLFNVLMDAYPANGDETDKHTR